VGVVYLLPAALRSAQAEADCEVFHPAGATRCTDGGAIWQVPSTESPLLRAKFHHHLCNDKQWRSQELFPWGAKVRGKPPSGVQGRSPGGGLGAQPTEADDITIKYVQLYSTYVNQGRSDDSDTAHSTDTDRQWHRHHNTPALPPTPVS